MTAIDPKKSKRIARYPYPGTLYALVHDAREGRLYGGGSDYAVHTVDLDGEKPEAPVAWSHHRNYVAAMTLLERGPDGRQLVSVAYDRLLQWTGLRDGELVRSVHAHDGWLRDVALLAGGERLATVADDVALKIWDAGDGSLIHVLRGHEQRTPQGYLSTVYAVAAHPGEPVVATADRTGEVRLWDAAAGRELHRFRAAEFYTYDPKKRVRSIGGIRSLAFSPDGKRLALGGIGQVTNVDGFVGPCRVEVWDWQKPERTHVGTAGHKAVFNKVLFHPADDLLIAAGGGDGGGVIGFWNTTDEKPVHLAKFKGHAQDFALDAEAGLLHTAGHGGFETWDLTGTREERFPEEKEEKK